MDRRYSPYVELFALISSAHHGPGRRGCAETHVALTANRLDDAGKKKALELVTELAYGGARLRGEPGYRGPVTGTPEALVELFGSALITKGY
ncbi:hypothetical protein BH09MYX1_BH09MYX1_66860 [soil metagenome]